MVNRPVAKPDSDVQGLTGFDMFQTKALDLKDLPVANSELQMP
jgi:hypothetical protein